MGLLGGIGKAFKSIGKAVSKTVSSVAKGVTKFANSPIGKKLIGIGLSALTGGVGGAISKALGALKFGGIAQGLLGSFASKFLGPVTNLLSQSGLSGLAGLVKTATNPAELLKIAQQLMSARSQSATPQLEPAVKQSCTEAANYNVQQMIAWQHAQITISVSFQ